MRKTARTLAVVGGVCGIVSVVALVGGLEVLSQRFKGSLTQFSVGFWVLVLVMLLASVIGISGTLIAQRFPVAARVIAEIVQLIGGVVLLLWSTFGITLPELWLKGISLVLLLAGVLLIVGAILSFLTFRQRGARRSEDAE